MMDLNTLWFMILGALLAVFVILDGYDLGIGVVHLFTRNREYRNTFMALIGPFWDGNEVWLIIAGGVLFAVFPRAYTALLSGFYPFFLLLLIGLIFRGLAISLRETIHSNRWRSLCDFCFGISSLAALLLFGILASNLARGALTDNNGLVRVSFIDCLSVPAIIGAGLSAALFTMHGALFGADRSNGEQQKYLEKWALGGWGAVAVFIVPCVALNINKDYALLPRTHPVFFAFVGLIFVSLLICIPWAIKYRRPFLAYLSSCVVVILSVAMLSVLLYPRLVGSITDDGHSLTIYNAAASHSAMIVMVFVLMVSLPLAIAYSLFVRAVLRRHPSDTRSSY